MKPTIAEIITAVAAEFEINPREITGTSRLYVFTHPRHMVCAIAHEAGYSLPVIAHRVGGRDHSSILYGVRQAVKIAAKNAAYRESLHKLRKSLLEGATDAAHKKRKYVFQTDCIAAIHKIADGHNDPRGLAQTIIAKMGDAT